MRILVDADACPVRAIIVKMARERNLPVLMICDTSHEIKDDYSTVITVSKGRDSADLKLANLLQAGDIVVTQDYGVAALALGKHAKAIRPDGLIFTDSNMDQLLFERHLSQKVRRAKGRGTHLSKRTSGDDWNFTTSFAKLLNHPAK